MDNSETNLDNAVDENVKLYTNLLKIVELINERQKHVLGAATITHSQYNILRTLQNVYPGSTNLKDIQKNMVFGSPDITRLIDRLVLKNWVSRLPNVVDKRKIDVQLSTEGYERLVDLNPKMEATVRNFFKSDISMEEAQFVNVILDRMMALLT